MIVYLFSVIFIIGHNNVVLASLSQAPTSNELDPFISWNDANPTKMPGAMYNLFVGYHSLKNRIWIVGGTPDITVSWYFDLNTNSWNVSKSMSYKIQSWSQSHTQMNDYIYFIDNNKLHQFDMNTGDITGTSPSLPTNVNSSCLANDNRYIFLIGGGPTFQIYDTLQLRWFHGKSLNEERVYLTCNISPNGQYLYVFGGRTSTSSDQYLSSMEKIDISNMANIESLTSEWEILPDLMISNVADSQSVVDPIHNLIYIIGGNDKNKARDDRVLIFNPETHSSFTSKVTLNIGRFHPGVIMINNNRIYVFGGHNKAYGGSLNTFEISNILHTSTPTPDPTSNPTYYPTVIPTATPTQTRYPTPTYIEDEDDDSIPTIILLIVVAANIIFIIIPIIIITIICWRERRYNKKTQETLEDLQDVIKTHDNDLMLTLNIKQETEEHIIKTHDNELVLTLNNEETEGIKKRLALDKFVVTEQDHAEMLEIERMKSFTNPGSDIDYY